MRLPTVTWGCVHARAPAGRPEGVVPVARAVAVCTCMLVCARPYVRACGWQRTAGDLAPGAGGWARVRESPRWSGPLRVCPRACLRRPACRRVRVPTGGRVLPCARAGPCVRPLARCHTHERACLRVCLRAIVSSRVRTLVHVSARAPVNVCVSVTFALAACVGASVRLCLHRHVHARVCVNA